MQTKSQKVVFLFAYMCCLSLRGIKIVALLLLEKTPIKQDLRSTDPL
jgi:hypothetical protein